MEEAFTDDGVMCNSAPFDGQGNREAAAGIIKLLEEKGHGKEAVNYKLRDWGISRQRYWGCPDSGSLLRKSAARFPVEEERCRCFLPEDVDSRPPAPLASCDK